MNVIISSWGLSSFPGEQSRGGFEDLVRAPGLGELACEALVLLLQIFSGRRLGDLVAVAVAPHAQGLLAYAELRGHSPDRVGAGPSFGGLWRSRTIRTARSRS
ncbi:hypothetical protein [Micrococcus lylae]|uniref:hypothetical protein n=1 Tax=Micrococcus lylae TaxID=1273 RepID=UPI0021A421B9|nr:hypothetical protein [Micrococcus lylae]MCT2008523.1 hypothetical protein [Micrococcus lylae]